MCYQREKPRAEQKNLSTTPLPKRSTRMNSCNTKYRQKPPSLVLFFTYSSSPNSCLQLTSPILFFNLVVESTIELKLQFQVTFDEYYKYAPMIPRGPIKSHYKKLDLWQRSSKANISPKNAIICPLSYSGIFCCCVSEYHCCTMTLRCKI